MTELYTVPILTNQKETYFIQSLQNIVHLLKKVKEDQRGPHKQIKNAIPRRGSISGGDAQFS